MAKKSGMKSCKKLDRSARLANHNKSVRSRKIANARNRHLKNAIRSCGEQFAEKLRAYYNLHPVSTMGRRLGNHIETTE